MTVENGCRLPIEVKVTVQITMCSNLVLIIHEYQLHLLGEGWGLRKGPGRDLRTRGQVRAHRGLTSGS